MHKACLHDVFTLKNSCPLCDQKILLGYEVCLSIPKMKQNRVIRKKNTVDQNVKKALQEQAEKNVAMQFGVSGMGLAMNEESKTSVVGRRDIFEMLVAANGDRPPIGKSNRVGPTGRPPLQNKKTPSQRNNFKHTTIEEEEKVPFSGLGSDFNLAGTQITTTQTNFPSASKATNKPNGRLAHAAQFKSTRPHSLNQRQPLLGNKEEQQPNGFSSVLEVGGSGFSAGPNKHRLARDMQQYRELEERDYDFLEEQ